MPSTVGTSTVSWAMMDPFQRGTLYVSGRHWVFYLDGTNFGWSSSVDGISWTAHYDYNTRFSGYSCIYWDAANGKVCLAQSNGPLVANILYREGTLNSDGTITWDFAEVIVTTDKCAEVALTKNTSGYPVISYCWNDGISAYHVRVITATATNGSTWAVPPVSISVDLDVFVVHILALTSNKLMAIRVPYSAGVRIQSKIYVGGSWAADWVNAASGYVYYPAASCSVADGDNVALVFLEITSGHINFNKYTYGVGWIATDETVHQGVIGYSHPAIVIIGANNYRVIFGHTSSSVAYIDRKIGVWDVDATDIATGESALSGHVGVVAPISPLSGIISIGWLTGIANPRSVRYAYQYIENPYIKRVQGIPGMRSFSQMGHGGM